MNPNVDIDQQSSSVQHLARLQAEVHSGVDWEWLGTVSAALIHEIRNVLTPAIAYASFDENDNADVKTSSSGAILKQLRRVSAITEECAIACTFSSRAVPVEGTAIIHEIIEEFRFEAEDASVELKAQAEPGCSILVDPFALRHVLRNAIRNAIQSCRRVTDRQRRITIGIDNQGSSARNTIAIAVEDNGYGMAANFVRILLGIRPLDATPRSEGLGIGLQICKRLVERSGGTLEIDSTVGKGTTLRVSFPSVPAARAA